MNWKSIAIRAGVTFVEAGLVTWALTGFKLDRMALGGAIGAGLSATYNITMQLVDNKRSK